MSELPEDPESEPPETSTAQRGLNFMLSYAARAGDYDVVAHALTLGGGPNYGGDFTFSSLHGPSSGHGPRAVQSGSTS